MDTQATISKMYSAFNDRDVDSALAFMNETVSWPKASEGGRIVGKQEIREYWARQWSEFDPHVQVLHVPDSAGGTVDVRVRQLVKDLKGNVLSDTEVSHVYTFADGFIERMDIKSDEGPSDGPSAAFSARDPK